MIGRRSVVGSVSSVAIGVLAGCAGVLDSDDENGDDDEALPPPVEEFWMEIIDVRSPDTGLTSATIPLVFEVGNAHDEREIPSPTLDYAATINGEEVMSAREDLSTLGPGDSVRVSIEMVLSYDDLGSAVIDAIRDGTFTVEIGGEMTSEGVNFEFSDVYEY